MKIGQINQGSFIVLDDAGTTIGVVVSYVSGNSTSEFWAFTDASGKQLPFDANKCGFEAGPSGYPSSMDISKLKTYATNTLGTSAYKSYAVSTNWTLA